MLSQKTIKVFLKNLSAKTPTPGGGSVAALSGAAAVGLVIMSARVSGYKTEKLVKCQQRLIKLIDEDTRAFNQVITAYRSQQNRKAKIVRALKRATEAPLRTAQCTYAVLRLAEGLVSKVKPTVISDIGVGVLLAEVAIRSALLNVRINLNSIKDMAFKKKIGKNIRYIVDYSLIAKKANRAIQERMK